LYQQKLSTAQGDKDAMMAQVQSLLTEMAQLQKDSDEAKRIGRQAGLQPDLSASALERRVKQLEAQNAALEEENRLLRQRDIMHRLVDLDQSGGQAKLGVNKDKLAAFNMPMLAPAGFAMKVDNGSAYETEARRRSTTQRVNDGAKARGTPAHTRWGVLRVAFKLSKNNGGSRSSRKVHPAKPTPKPLTKEDKAAIYIQKIWRGYMVRVEMAFWDYTDYFYDDL